LESVAFHHVRTGFEDFSEHFILKVIFIFEGRDAAGKGGVIKRIT
jgi:polyphosphate kinase 2 (PPK2 family)